MYARSVELQARSAGWLLAGISLVMMNVPSALAGATPRLSTISPSTSARSGRLELFGSGFGATQGTSQVLIDGLSAIATTWSDAEIHAYVPEGASLGPVPVQIITVAGASNALTLNVIMRQQNGRIQWQFQTDRWMTRQFVAVAPNGTVYTSDNLGLYALSADGALLWFAPGTGGGRPISLGPDGTIYTGATLQEAILEGKLVKALEPDGSLRWEFIVQPSMELLAGPNVGPDGNIYAMQDQFSDDPDSGLGMFSLDANGALRWSNDGDPLIFSLGGSNSEVVFHADRLYVGVKFTAAPPPTTFAFRLDDGNQLWYTWTGGLGVYFFSFPRVDPQGRAIAKWGQTGVITLLPGGQTDWIEIHPLDGGTDCTPAVDSQGVIFTGDDVGLDLWAVNPDGSTRWVQPSDSTLLNHLGVSPDDAVLVVAGHDTYGAPGWIRGYDASNGAFVWQVDLEIENGLVQGGSMLYPAFSNDAATAYVTTVFNNVNINDYGYLYAISIGDAPPSLPGDIDGDGVADMEDIAMFVDVLTGLDADPGHISASDLNGDGAADGKDVDTFVGLMMGG